MLIHFMKFTLPTNIAILLFSFIFSGCASLEPATFTVRTEHKKICNYVLGEPLRVSVGQPLIKRMDYYVKISGAFTVSPQEPISYTASIPFNRNVITNIVPEVDYEIIGTLSGNSSPRSVVFIGKTNRGVTVGLLLDQDDMFTGEGVWQNGMNGWQSGGGASFEIRPAVVKFKREVNERVVSGQKYENFEIIYTGKSKNGITLLYREYSPDDLARTPYYQNLSFDLDESGIIGFKEFRIKILHANNEGIEAIVLSH